MSRIELILVSFFLAFGFSLGEIYFISGEGKRRYNVNGWKNISIVDEKIVKVMVSTFPTVESDLYHSQRVHNYKLTWDPRPFKKEIRFDRFSNEVLEAYFKPVRYQGQYNTINYEVSFDVELSTSIYPTVSLDTFPVSPGDITDYERQFLEEGRGIRVAHPDIVQTVEGIGGLTSNIALAVHRLVAWIRHQIKWYHSSSRQEGFYREVIRADLRPYFNSDEVLKNRKATLSGRINLFIAMARTLGIPTRVVKGLTVGDDISVEHPLESYFIRSVFPRGEWVWIEVFLPRFGWMPVHLDDSSLLQFPVYIKKRVGIDLLDLIEFERKGRHIVEEYFFERKEDEHRYWIGSKLDVLNDIVYFPPINLEETKKIIDGIPRFHEGLSDSVSLPSQGDFRGRRIESIKIRGTTPSLQYGQRFTLNKKAEIKKISLMLFKLDSVEGGVRVELYRDKEGSPEEMVMTSRWLSLAQVDETYMFKWRAFILSKIDSKTSRYSLLSPGDYWIIPRIRGRSVLHWAFFIDVNTGSVKDSFFLDKKRRVKELLDGDFAYHVDSVPPSSKDP